MSRVAAAERALRDALIQVQGLRWAYLFGSAARGEESFRDVDMAVMPGPSWSAMDHGRLRIALEGVVGTDVDLVDLRSATLPLLGSILRERKVLYDAERSERHAWEATTASRWLDFEPAWRRQSQLRREALLRRRRKDVG